jgi:uncharacterized protein
MEQKKMQLLTKGLLWALLVLANVAVAQESSSLLWEARSGNKTVFLFGTIHVGRPDFYPLPKSVEEAFAASTTVALEADFSDPNAMGAAMQIGTLPQGRYIEGELSTDLASQLRRTVAASGLQMASFRSMKPFMAMLALVSMEYAKLGYSPEFGLDLHFAQRAKEEAKPVIGLESIEGQMRMMDSLSKPLQQAMLKITLDDMATGNVGPVAGRLISAWRKGDAESVHEVLVSESKRLDPALDREFQEKFLGARNRVMLSGVEKALNGTDKLFVAVGALHLVGPGSLTELLEKKGYVVKRK